MAVIDKWFTHEFTVTRKVYSDTFASEPFVAVGTITGFIQPISGILSQRSGKESAEASAMLFTGIDSDVHTGDRITDTKGRVWVANFVQEEGISAIQDHQEIPVELTT